MKPVLEINIRYPIGSPLSNAFRNYYKTAYDDRKKIYNNMIGECFVLGYNESKGKKLTTFDLELQAVS